MESLSVVADDFQRPWFGRICLLAHPLHCSANYNTLVLFACWVFWYLLLMASKSSNFLDGLEFYFITKKLVKVRHKLLVDKIQRFEGTVSNRFNENTTHARAFPCGVDYHSSLHSFHSTHPQDKSGLCLLTGYLLVVRKGKSYQWHN